MTQQTQSQSRALRQDQSLPLAAGLLAVTAALFGFAAVQTLGQSVDMIIPPHLREAHWRGFERAMQRGACSRPSEVRTTRGLHQDGRRLYVDMSFSVVKDAAGQVLGSAAMARDATARYLAEQAMRAGG